MPKYYLLILIMYIAQFLFGEPMILLNNQGEILDRIVYLSGSGCSVRLI